MPAECSVGAKPCVPFSCLTHLLEDQAKRIPDAPAILAVGRAPLTYAGLYQHINKTGRTLRAMGIGPDQLDFQQVAHPETIETALSRWAQLDDSDHEGKPLELAQHSVRAELQEKAVTYLRQAGGRAAARRWSDAGP
jgi:hypothetical protein